MPIEVIAHVNAIGERQKMLIKLIYANRYGKEIEDTLDELDVDSSDNDLSYRLSDDDSYFDSDNEDDDSESDESNNESSDSDNNDDDNVIPLNNEANLPPSPDNIDSNPDINVMLPPLITITQPPTTTQLPPMQQRKHRVTFNE